MEAFYGEWVYVSLRNLRRFSSFPASRLQKTLSATLMFVPVFILMNHLR